MSAIENTFKALFKIVDDYASGGGFEGAGPFRPLYEPPEDENTYKDLAKYFDRAELESEWATVKANKEHKAHDFMKPALKNDLVAPIHRDMWHRYSGRIHRMLHNQAVTINNKHPTNSTIGFMKTTIKSFDSLKGDPS